MIFIIIIERRELWYFRLAPMFCENDIHILTFLYQNDSINYDIIYDLKGKLILQENKQKYLIKPLFK